MKERPILFSAPMVRAILAGTKTQTRRVVKPCKDLSVGCELAGEVNAGDYSNAKYEPGDRLWVREAFDFIPSGGPDDPQACEIVYWATGNSAQRAAPSEYNPMIYGHEKVRPSIHMPRWASRITLEITGVRVERLQDISEADAVAEGIEPLSPPPSPHEWSGPNRFTLRGMGNGACAGQVSWNAPTAIELYRRLWESINGPGSWEANPWVWVIEFQRVEGNHQLNPTTTPTPSSRPRSTLPKPERAGTSRYGTPPCCVGPPNTAPQPCASAQRPRAVSRLS